MATDLGKVGMRMRGDWDSSTAYEVLDAVSYNSSLYIAKQAVPANTLPTNTTYWQLALDSDVKRTNATVSIKPSDIVDITGTSGANYYLLMLNSNSTGLMGAFLVIGYGGGSTRNVITTLLKGNLIDTVGFTTTDNTDQTLKVTFTGSFGDRTLNVVVVSFTSKTFTISVEA